MDLSRYRSIQLLKELEDEELAALSEKLTERKAGKGESIVRSDAQSDTMMFIVQGSVRVSLTGDDGKEVVLTHLGQGEFFGEISMLTGEQRSADVSAIEDVRLLELKRSGFEEHANRFGGFSLALLRELALRLKGASRKIGDLALLDVYRRVAATLKSLGQEERREDKAIYVISKRPTHQELSAMVGTSREMVTRALKGLEEDGHIKVVGKRIELFSSPR